MDRENFEKFNNPFKISKETLKGDIEKVSDSKFPEKRSFYELIKEFNEMYGLPKNDKPSLPSLKRLENFKNVLQEEVSEVEGIIDRYKELIGEIGSEDKIFPDGDVEHEKKIEILTEISDWLGDMMVYITSEATKYGLDMEEILRIIMESNFSKLGEDGKPIYDERGKVMKGPNYWKPEERIREYLSSRV